MSTVRVGVIYGGRSSEHSISCVSAGSILKALDRDGYDVVQVGITREGGWYRQHAQPEDLRIVDGVLPQVHANDEPVVLAADPTRMDPLLGSLDVIFPVLHGPFGEDGTVQGVLEMAGIPYVGSGVLASAAAMEKGAMKALFAQAGLEVGPYEIVTDRAWRTDRAGVLERVAALGFPVFVKPSRAGSSQGITKVKDAAGLVAAIEEARSHDPRLVIEAGFESVREIECAVLVDVAAGGVPRASRCAEIIIGGDHEFYDFAAKYLEDAAELVVPADLDPAIERRVQELAVVAFESLGCEGLARVDFFVLPDGRVVINEVNTMPGFTPISMYPRMWAHSGIDYADLVDRLIADALERGTGLR